MIRARAAASSVAGWWPPAKTLLLEAGSLGKAAGRLNLSHSPCCRALLTKSGCSCAPAPRGASRLFAPRRPPTNRYFASALGLYRGNPLVISGLRFWSGQRKFFKENLANPANQYETVSDSENTIINMNERNDKAHGMAWSELEAVIGQVWVEIDNATRQHDAEKVLTATERLRRLKAIAERYQIMQRELQVLAGGTDHGRNVGPGPNTPTKPPADPPYRDVASAKARGEKARTEWVEARLREGYNVKPIRGSIYRNATGDSVGIAYGMENSRRSDHWFLGLPEGSFQNAALLCDANGKGLFTLGLPQEFLDTHGLRKCGGPQVKFNVTQRGAQLYLRVQEKGLVDVSVFKDQYAKVLY